MSQGVPRLINVICDRALLGAYSSESRRVSRTLVRRAAAEISGKRYTSPLLRWATPIMISVGLALISFGGWSIYSQPPATAEQKAVTVSPVTTNLPIELPDLGHEEPAFNAGEVLIDVPPPEVTLDEQLRLAVDLTNFDTALETLIERWGLANSSCEQLVAMGYECLGQRGSWNNLRQLNRPAILTLTDTLGESHRVVLTHPAYR